MSSKPVRNLHQKSLMENTVLDDPLPDLIASLRLARDLAENEIRSEVLCFLIDQAINEAEVEVARRTSAAVQKQVSGAIA